MAGFDKKPSTWLPNWTEDATNITVPLATFPELTAAEADAAAGDIRKIMFAILEQQWNIWRALATADKPTMMNMVKTATINPLTGDEEHLFTIRFTNTRVAQGSDVKDEPA
jgi:hypothetical protein